MATATVTRNGKAAVQDTAVDMLKRLGFAEAFNGNDGKTYVTGYRSGRVAVALYEGKLQAFVLEPYDREDKVYPAYKLEGCRIELTESGRVRLTIGNASHLFDHAKLVARWLYNKLPKRLELRLKGVVELPSTAEAELREYAMRNAK